MKKYDLLNALDFCQGEFQNDFNSLMDTILKYSPNTKSSDFAVEVLNLGGFQSQPKEEKKLTTGQKWAIGLGAAGVGLLGLNALRNSGIGDSVKTVSESPNLGMPNLAERVIHKFSDVQIGDSKYNPRQVISEIDNAQRWLDKSGSVGKENVLLKELKKKWVDSL